ncbi:MAG: hypothetical protein P1U80_08555 [Pseudomonadales bacterium]|nr:hypothetical protein [Pseudomonadales bacterium]
MKKRFSISGLRVLLLVGLFQSQAIALGLGDIELKSALNQPFNATIQLINTGGLTEEEIITNLASKQDFERAGVDRFFFLTELKFGVYIESETSGVIHITTRNPVDEPYLDFIIETQWPTGRMLREYTVLLDPPTFIDAAAAPVEVPVVQLSPVSNSETVGSAVDSNAISTVPTAGIRSQSLSAGENGFIQTTNETLWEVALKARPSSEYSVQQTMMAIQDQNPRAFMKGNINLIKQHQKIKVPTPEQIRSRSQRQAVRDVAYQNKMFSEGRPLPTKPQIQPLVATKSNIDRAGMASDVDQAELKLVSASEGSTDQAAGGDKAASGTTPDALKDALAVSEENLDKSEQEKLELSNRMAELEKNLETMRKLLTLKDEQMALLQAEIDKSGDVVTPTEQPAPPLGVESSKPVLTPAVETVEQKVNKKSVSKVESTPPITPEVPAQPIASDADWLSVLKDNLYLLGVAAVLAVLALVLIFRKKNEVNVESDTFESDIDDLQVPLTDNDFNQEGLEDISDFDDIEELSEELGSGDLSSDTLQTEVKAETSDVLAEADIYLAYGRAQPAIDILSSAIKDEPGRIDLRIKLLEIHADQNDSVSFDKELAQLAELNDDTANQQAAELRTRMVVDDEASGDADDLVFDLYNENESSATAQDVSVVEPEAETEIAELDFGVSDPMAGDDTPVVEGDLDLPDLSFENTESDQVVSSLEKSIAEHESKDEKDIGEIDFDIDMDDFDLDSGDDLLGGVDAASESEQPLGQGYNDKEDSDLDSINMQMRVEAEAIVARIQEQDVIAPEADTTSGDDLDSLHMKIQENIGLDLDSEDDNKSDVGSLSIDETEHSADIDEFVDYDAEITTDESETKIDLARAYVEMEDFEGAQELLKEVLQEGTAEQKETVKQILASIS